MFEVISRDAERVVFRNPSNGDELVVTDGGGVSGPIGSTVEDLYNILREEPHGADEEWLHQVLIRIIGRPGPVREMAPHEPAGPFERISIDDEKLVFRDKSNGKEYTVPRDGATLLFRSGTPRELIEASIEGTIEGDDKAYLDDQTGD